MPLIENDARSIADQQWLAELGEGDEVAISYARGTAPLRARITKSTPSRLGVDNQRFRRSDGYRLDDRTCRLEPIT